MNDETTTLIEGDEDRFSSGQAPLCLKDYFAEREECLRKNAQNGPPRTRGARIVERSENLIVLNFSDEPKKDRGRLTWRLYEIGFLAMFLTCIAAVIASFSR